MLLLTSTADKLQVITGSAGAIDVHASWMDNVAGAVAPGRTNTNISTAATTDVVASPAASTQRNIKTLHIRNRGVSANAVTVQHTDGTTVAQLHKRTLQPNETLQYIDEIGFVLGAAGVIPITQVITASGTYTPTSGLLYAVFECIGGGAGGGGAACGTGSFCSSGGGGSGGYSRATKTAAQIGASQVLTVGPGGAGGANSTTAGSPGGDSSVGTLCVAKGGLGGGPNDLSGGGAGAPLGKGGAGGSISGAAGDVIAAGSPGGNGLLANSTLAVFDGAPGGSSYYGGGAPGVTTGNGTSVVGANASAYGGGGGGAFANQSATVVAGGNGSPGVIIITEHFR